MEVPLPLLLVMLRLILRLLTEEGSEPDEFRADKLSRSLYRLDRITWMFSMSMNTIATTDEPPTKLMHHINILNEKMLLKDAQDYQF